MSSPRSSRTPEQKLPSSKEKVRTLGVLTLDAHSRPLGGRFCVFWPLLYTVFTMERLAKLFGSQSRIKILRLFLFNKDSAFSTSEVAERAKVSKEAARKEVVELVATGLLRKKGAGSPARYQVNPHFEYLEPLDVFIRETTSVRPKSMVETLRRAGPLRLVALSGLFTGAEQAQVDLLVVGDTLDERVLTTAVRALEAELGREIRYASFSTPDFRYRLGIYDRLLRDVFDYPHRLLIDKIGA